MNTIVAIIIAVVLGFGLSALLGIKLIPWLHKIHFGQTILDIGPNWHKKKQGTPTMGGFMFIISTIVTFFIVVLIDKLMGGTLLAGTSLDSGSVKVKIFAGLLLAVGFGIIGFLDDYIKVKLHRNEGLTVIQKTILEVIISGAYTASLVLSNNVYMWFPHSSWDYGGGVGGTIFFCIFTMLVIYATTNAVNFTDGVDGLCSSVTIIAAISFAIMAALRQMMGVSVLAAALAGACAGYLIWNWHPAKCFMGDTGSMFLGGMVVALAYDMNSPLLLLLVGIIYVIEGLSDVIQILYFKATRKIAQKKDPNATGKRLFKMAPIHHHFEKCGWSEEKICCIFSAVNMVGGIIAILIVNSGRS